MADKGDAEICILNHSQGETVCYPLVLLEGTILDKRRQSKGASFDDSAGKHQALDSEYTGLALSHTEIRVLTMLVECGSFQMKYSVISGGFKAVVPLTTGENNIRISLLNSDVIERNFRLTYAPLTMARFVRVVYVLCADSDGSFDAPIGVVNDVNAAIRRLSFNARLLQTFMAESLYQHGLGHRTFRIEEDEFGCPKVHLFTSTLKTCQALNMTGDQLYRKFNEELDNSSLNDPLCKLWTFMSCTHYDPPPPETFDDKQVAQYIKAHTALGGGQLALFGTGGLHTWASSIQEMVPCFTDTQVIDRHTLFDDSGGRGFYWANYATGLGASMHELGHCFDLAHTPKGIMGRGFDDMNRVFALWNKPSPILPGNETTVGQEFAGIEVKDVSDEGSIEETQRAIQETAACSTSVAGLVPKQVNSGSKQISSQSSSIATPNEWSHGAQWYRSSAVLLRYHKWLSITDSTDDDDFTKHPIVHWCKSICGPVGNCEGCHQSNQTLFNTYKWLKSQNATLIGYIIHANKYVNSIQTIGSVQKLDTGDCEEVLSEPQGTDGIGKRYTFMISCPDEYVTGVDVRAGGWVDAIRIHTNQKSSIWMGGRGGNEYHLRPPPRRNILGLVGTSGELIESIGLLLDSEQDAVVWEANGIENDSLHVQAPFGIRLIELWDKKHSEVYQHWEFLDSQPPKEFCISRAETKKKASTLLVEDDKGNISRTSLVHDYSDIL